MSFIPEGYKIPQTSGNYMKLQDGENEILALDSIIHGFIYWNIENKPVRSQEHPKNLTDARPDSDGKVRVKAFWAFPAWNVREERFQILEITQKSIMGTLQSLAQNKKWGDPICTYTISITRSGEGLDTEYYVQPNPKGDDSNAVVEKAMEAYEQARLDGFDISRLFNNGDPFTPDNSAAEAEAEAAYQGNDAAAA